MPIESAFWCNLSTFTFSASLPLNECLWITFPAISQFLVYLFNSFVCPGFPSFWFTYSTVLYVQGSKKKKKIPSRTRVFETRVPSKIEGKKIPPVEPESLKLEFYWGNFFPHYELESLRLEFYWEFFFSPLDMQNCWICEPKTGKSWTYKTAA